MAGGRERVRDPARVPSGIAREGSGIARALFGDRSGFHWVGPSSRSAGDMRNVGTAFFVGSNTRKKVGMARGWFGIARNGLEFARDFTGWAPDPARSERQKKNWKTQRKFISQATKQERTSLKAPEWENAPNR